MHYQQIYMKIVASQTKKMHVILKNLKNEIPLNKLSFIIGDSMVNNFDGYFLTGSLNRKFIVKVTPFSLAFCKNIGYVRLY